jgi:hypothetical protein
MWIRLLQMYTNINLCCILLMKWFPKWLQDIVRASALLILIVVIASVWLSGNAMRIYINLVESFVNDIPEINGLSDKEKIKGAIAFDMLLHVIPVMIIGFPIMSISVVWAYIMLITYCIIYRDSIKYIYVPDIAVENGIMSAGLVTILMNIIY